MAAEAPIAPLVRTPPVRPERPPAHATFIEEVIANTPGDCRLGMCIQCGTCGGSCPSAADMDHTPRMLFAMIRAGMRDATLRSNTPWMCVSCYLCVERCPQEVHITDVMYTLKTLAVREHLYQDSAAPEFSKVFVGNVENYGRSFELGLASKYFIRHFPLGRLPSMAPMGLGMLSRGRMAIRPPHRIDGIEQLRAVLAKAKELETAP